MSTDSAVLDTPPSSPPPLTGESTKEPNLAIAGTTKARCATCGHQESWTGRAEIPECPNGHGRLLVVATTAQTATEAIAMAAQQVPEKTERPSARQMSIPGLRPPFDFQAAMESIFEQRRIVKAANTLADRRSLDASGAKKIATSEQEKLSRLEDDYDTRYHDVLEETERLEERKQWAARPREKCAYELATGLPCSICNEPRADHSDNVQSLTHAASAAIVGANDLSLTPAALQMLLRTIGHRFLVVDTIAVWTNDQQRAVASWLERRANDQALGTDTTETDPAPAVLGRAHEIAAKGYGQCRACGQLLHPLAETFGLVKWEPGSLVGTDCEGESAAEPARRTPKRHALKAAAPRAKSKPSALSAGTQRAVDRARGKSNTKKRSRRP